jgi:hypothetical protein
MRIFTNKYISYQLYSVIKNNIKESPDIMKVENKIYIPITINNIISSNNHMVADVYYSSLLPLHINEYKTKFLYKNNKYFDLLHDDNFHSLNIQNTNNRYLNYEKNIRITVSTEIKNGDIILIEDKNFSGVI